jgi:hypothetical protein
MKRPSRKLSKIESYGVAMRKAILMMILAVVSNSAAAKWVKVAENETNIAYVDSATIRKAGNVATMWSLFDYKTSVVLDHGKRYMSTRARFEYDCKDERMRGLDVSFHSARMAGGEVVHSSLDPGTWGPIPPDTVNAALWKIACRKQ